ncbi:uroporphyrinogen-III synthase [Bacillus sp. NSP9.1]|uniref:uroporphyrinogen-III synthase n=1 Tax=Bacillus sp. NSP9.1 TaxID=1071078 RepID=UPI000405E46E|nr:uroporphyrinogen-III synthase [Bacillus sp. NSP9.1]QHZ47834.1 uroporphyrinogen-III synthase [Bacillus sp. NSP9.1]
MGKGLNGSRIAIGASRKTEEMSTLIKKQGGIPVVRSLQGTVFLAEKEVGPDLQTFVETGADWVIFTTGIGTETLVSLAEKLGIGERFLQVIRQAKAASRGYKTAAALKKLGITPTASDDDGTTKGLIESLKPYDFTGKRVMVQLHGENAPSLLAFLEEKGAAVFPLLPYQHVAPDEETVALLCQELLDHEVDAVCFTTAVQVRSLFKFAKENGVREKIVQAFQDHVLAAAVGKVTAEALSEEGVVRLLAPELERMGAMIVELSRFYETDRNPEFDGS